MWIYLLERVMETEVLFFFTSILLALVAVNRPKIQKFPHICAVVWLALFLASLFAYVASVR